MKPLALCACLAFCTPFSAEAVIRLDLELHLHKGRLLSQSTVIPEGRWTRVTEDEVAIDLHVTRPKAGVARVDFRVVDLADPVPSQSEVLASGLLTTPLGNRAQLQTSELDGGEIARFTVTPWEMKF